jgi:hypothetical protein
MSKTLLRPAELGKAEAEQRGLYQRKWQKTETNREAK